MQVIAPFNNINTILIMLGPLATLFPTCIGMDPKRVIMSPTSVTLAQTLMSVVVWSALELLLQLLRSWARSCLTQQELQAAGMPMVAGPVAVCAATSHTLIRSVGACELNSDMQ